MKYLNGEYYVEVKDIKFIQLKKSFYENEIHQNLLELNIKYKITLR